MRATLARVLPETAIDDFLAHRKRKRAPVTVRAAELIARDLEGHPDPAAVVELSVKHGWTGLFPERVGAVPRPADSAAFLDGIFARIEAGRTGT